MRVFGAFEKKKKKKLTRGFLGKRYGRYDDDDGIHNGVYVARMMMGRGRGHLHVVRAKQTTELERDRLDIEISSTWDESMEDDFEFDEDGQLLDAFGEEIDTTEVKKAIPGDFYSLIQVPKDASSAEIKKGVQEVAESVSPGHRGRSWIGRVHYFERSVRYFNGRYRESGVRRGDERAGTHDARVYETRRRGRRRR